MPAARAGRAREKGPDEKQERAAEEGDFLTSFPTMRARPACSPSAPRRARIGPTAPRATRASMGGGAPTALRRGI
eukprot:10431243-Lingulodinium_polyedra.AAC.1